jgi:O-antigen ligase
MSSPSPLAVVQANTNIMQKLAYLFLLVYLFILYSRVFDMMLGYLHIPAIISCCFMLFGTLGGGVFSRALSSRIGILLTVFTAWAMGSIVFSVWPGGAFEIVFGMWGKSFIFYVFSAGLLVTSRHCQRAMYVFAAAVLLLSGIGLLFGDMSSGRLYLPQGRFATPNDLAQILVIGLPFWWLINRNMPANVFAKILPLLAMVPILIVIGKTGSRGALIGFAAVVSVLFLRSSFANKMKLATVGILVILLGLIFVPRPVLQRYFVFFDRDSDSTSAMDDIAVSSSEARLHILLQSIRITLQHPVFGVGAGQFQVAATEDSREHNERAQWKLTHNMYTELSSECGIPALLFYVTAMVYSFKWTKALYAEGALEGHPEREKVANMAFCLTLSLIAFGVTSLFSSVAYQSLFPTLAGLAVALSRSVKQELALCRPVAPSSAAAQSSLPQSGQLASSWQKRFSQAAKPMADRRYRSR